MALATQFLIRAPHQAGTLAQVCSELAKVAVNITAIMASHDEAGGLRIVATPQPAARTVLQKLGLPFSEEEVLAVRVTDRPGALGKITRKLADAGINIEYAYGSIVKGESRALIILKVADAKKAADLV
jgi:hypothetical protein